MPIFIVINVIIISVIVNITACYLFLSLSPGIWHEYQYSACKGQKSI